MLGARDEIELTRQRNVCLVARYVVKYNSVYVCRQCRVCTWSCGGGSIKGQATRLKPTSGHVFPLAPVVHFAVDCHLALAQEDGGVLVSSTRCFQTTSELSRREAQRAKLRSRRVHSVRKIADTKIISFSATLTVLPKLAPALCYGPTPGFGGGACAATLFYEHCFLFCF